MKNWQGAWATAGKWHEFTIEELRLSLDTIQNTIREDGISSLAIAIIQGRQTRGLDDHTELPLPHGLKEKIIALLDDSHRRIRLGACSEPVFHNNHYARVGPRFFDILYYDYSLFSRFVFSNPLSPNFHSLNEWLFMLMNFIPSDSIVQISDSRYFRLFNFGRFGKSNYRMHRQI